MKKKQWFDIIIIEQISSSVMKVKNYISTSVFIKKNKLIVNINMNTWAVSEFQFSASEFRLPALKFRFPASEFAFPNSESQFPTRTSDFQPRILDLRLAAHSTIGSFAIGKF